MAYTIYQKGIRRPVRGVLFDMDGVVLDTEALYARFWREAAKVLGHDMSYEQALGMRSLSPVAGQAQLERYFGKGVSRAEFRKVRIERMDAYIDEHGVDLKPGIRELLDVLDSKGIPAAITTSSPIERYSGIWDLTACCLGFSGCAAARRWLTVSRSRIFICMVRHVLD